MKVELSINHREYSHSTLLQFETKNELSGDFYLESIIIPQILFFYNVSFKIPFMLTLQYSSF